MNSKQNDLLNLAQLYASGKLAPECDDEMFEVYRQVGREGGHQTMLALGMCYEFGWGISRQLEAAMDCYASAAELGSFEALERFSNMSSDPPLQSKKQQIFWRFNKKAELNDANAQLSAGYCYFHEIGTPEDKSKARELFVRAADQNNANAVQMLDECCHYGFGDRYAGMQPIALLKRAAKMGCAEAQYKLGFAYQHGYPNFGLGVEEDGYQAIIYYQQAADQNHASAMLHIARCFYRGTFAQKDPQKALLLWKKSALLGYDESQYYISILYKYQRRLFGAERGRNSTNQAFSDYEALYWNIKAASQGRYYFRPELLKFLHLSLDQINQLMKQTGSFASAEVWREIGQQCETGDGVKMD